jgi:hypothetical protein
MLLTYKIKKMENGTNPPKAITKPAKKGNVPAADINFGSVAQSVSENWSKNLWLTLRWLTPEQFTITTVNYVSILTSRNQTGSKRPQITQSLKALDKKIDSSVSYVKGYITDKYKKEASKSYYGAFGLVHKNGNYTIPSDQNSRLDALGFMIDGLEANDFSKKEYGVAFWSAIKDEYKVLLNNASTTDGKVSSNVGNKNNLKKELKKGLNAIVKALQANYPDSYKTELRTWGFQKEKY